MPRNTDRLDRYRQKRQPGKTPEPFGDGRVPATGRLFVFHKHHARNLHWDLRLEWEGALESWAVPRGPSANPKDKRLAMHVEPHPLDYAEFEGVIPEGEYGAGPSIVWDKGVWIPREDFREGMGKGKLLFELRGYKVRGVFTLVHTPKAGENNWLLIKEKDAYVDERGTEAYPDESIYSGLVVDDLPDAAEIAEQLAERAAEAGARRAHLNPHDVEVMKATPREDAFTDPKWVFELKYDGYRLIAAREDDEGVLISRNGNVLTDTFPEIARAVRGLPYPDVVLDGEVVVLDERGVPSFDRLQRRGKLTRRSDVARAALELPAVYYAFDLLGFGGLDLRKMPLVARKALLQEMLPPAGPIRYSEHIQGQGEAMYEQVISLGLEGIVAKRAESTYVGARTREWYKIPAQKNDDFVIIGWSDPKGGRVGLGALHLAQYVDGELTYAGSVGTGFTDAKLKELLAELQPLTIDVTRPDVVGEPPKGRAHHWALPKLVAEVRYKELTSAGVVRHAVFLRLRDDKRPDECVRQEGARGAADHEPLPEPAPVVAEPRVIAFTNPDKVFWPEEGYTKGELIEYYRKISPWLMPYLVDRPVVLTRYPDGITGKSFYQKDAPEWAPDWVETARVQHESTEKAVNYFVASDPESLLYLVNLGTIPLHLWHSRTTDLTHPDWCLMDLDPKDAPFKDVVEVALFLHDLCEEIRLPHYVKTTGSSGIHILIPLAGQMDYDQSRTLGELLARVTVKALPKISTITRALKSREGKVYVDFMQNAQGQLMAAPFCVRPRVGATVSAPLTWDEVGPKLDMQDYTIKTMLPRMQKLEKKGIGDPCSPVLTEKPDLLAALQGLTEKMAR